MAVGKLLRSCGLRLGTVKWRGVMIRAGEGGVAYFVRQTPKEDDSSRIQERPPPHFKSTHGFQTPSALMSPDWIACRSFSGQTSVYLPIFLSLWASLLSSRQNSVERHLFKKELSECEITVQMPKYSVLTVTAQLESDVLGFSINWNLKWTARGKCYCSEAAMET